MTVPSHVPRNWDTADTTAPLPTSFQIEVNDDGTTYYPLDNILSGSDIIPPKHSIPGKITLEKQRQNPISKKQLLLTQWKEEKRRSGAVTRRC